MKKTLASVLALVVVITVTVVGVKYLKKHNTPTQPVSTSTTQAVETTTVSQTTTTTQAPTTEVLTDESGQVVSTQAASSETVTVKGDTSENVAKKISWNPVSGATSYKVYRATSQNGSYTYIGTSTTNSYVDKTAVSGVEYYYKVGYVKTTTTTTKPTTQKPRIVTTTKKTTTTTKKATTSVTVATSSGLKTGFEQEMLGYINAARAAQGIAPLSMTSDLTRLARIRAQELTEYYASNHARPSGKAWSTILDESNDSTVTSWTTAGENIARGQTSTKQVFDEWMGSPGHKKNILNPEFTYVGLGCCSDGSQLYWEQIFIG